MLGVADLVMSQDPGSPGWKSVLPVEEGTRGHLSAKVTEWVCRGTEDQFWL